jgi:hypothetical protein
MALRKDMLTIILAPQFHPYVLAGGIVLLVLVAIRAVALWQMAGQQSHTHTHHHHHHNHDHHHDHDHGHHHHHHDHHHHHHDHDHGHIQHKPEGLKADAGLSLPLAAGEHGHAHETGHEHCDHDHGHCHHDHAHDHGHEHGWAPWRYTVLMLPVVLYFLNLPNEGFSARYKDLEVQDFAAAEREAAVTATAMLASPSGGGPLLAVNSFVAASEGLAKLTRKSGRLEHLRFSELEQAAYSPERREQYEGKEATLVGKFVASGDQRQFQMIRFKMNCCAADALPLNAVIMVHPEWKGKTLDVRARHQQWVKVTGVIHFLPKRGSPGEFISALIVFPTEENPPDRLVQIVSQPANPYAD